MPRVYKRELPSPVKEQASVLVLCLCMYELWMSGGKGGILGRARNCKKCLFVS